jgi:hypothetical protein
MVKARPSIAFVKTAAGAIMGKSLDDQLKEE